MKQYKKDMEFKKRQETKAKLEEDYLKAELKCSKCGQTQPNMPSLKRHISTHN